jgi:hypothetical protein
MLIETIVRSAGYFIEFLFKMLPAVICVYAAFVIYYWKK